MIDDVCIKLYAEHGDNYIHTLHEQYKSFKYSIWKLIVQQNEGFSKYHVKYFQSF